MILQVSGDASLLVRGAAALVLTLHIAGGSVGILSGFASLAFRKGGRAHRIAGNAFFISMMAMSSIGALVSPFLPTPQWPNVVAGVFTFYLITTSWMTVRRKAGTVGAFEMAALIGALSVIAGGVLVAVFAAKDPTAGSSYVFSIIAALAAIGDYKMLSRGGIFGARRIARHLWRMCVALFIAAGSLFLGQPQLFPASVHGTGLLFVPEIAIIVAIVYWSIRVRTSKQY